MIKRIIIGILFFASGIGIGIFSDSFFRQLIQDLFQWTTNNGIQFGGKDFYLFGNPISFISFGLTSLLFYHSNKTNKFSKILWNGIILIIIFGIGLISISALNAHFKIIECTACDNGIRRLGYNEIYYGLIIALSLLFSIIPSLIKIIKNLKKANVQQRV
ncbi:hypothetical protein [Xanthomarina spongicola]|uniref:hypothetical protein n=1 Tax=Xanthomarina spongicola TaxID=570520 RepID=UPI000D6D7B61|nr:hypothetical protein [Xanthomarina spongicola]